MTILPTQLPSCTLRSALMGATLLISQCSRCAQCQDLAPVILVPGLGGTTIRARLHAADAAQPWCSTTTSEWFTQWPAVHQFLPFQKECLVSRLQIFYNATTRTYSNARGVELDTNYDFGGVDAIEYLVHGAVPYYASIIQHLETKLGYRRGVNLHGAPYDWRLAPDGHNGGSISAFYPRMKALIEQTVLANGGLAAHLITHSLGGPTVLAFLNGQSHAWIEQNVASFIPIAGPWGGSTEMLLSQVSGFTFGIPGAPYHYLHRFQASAASGVFILPTAAAFGDEPVMSTPDRSYTAGQLRELLRDLGLQQQLAIYDALAMSGKDLSSLRPPPIPTHAIWGSGKTRTAKRYSYPRPFSSSEYAPAPSMRTEEDGDGVVNLRSLQVPLQWQLSADKCAAPITVLDLKGSGHQKVLSDPRLLKHLEMILRNPAVIDSNKDQNVAKGRCSGRLADIARTHGGALWRVLDWVQYERG